MPILTIKLSSPTTNSLIYLKQRTSKLSVCKILRLLLPIVRVMPMAGINFKTQIAKTALIKKTLSIPITMMVLTQLIQTSMMMALTLLIPMIMIASTQLTL